MKFLGLALSLAATASAHSWLECVDTQVSNYDAVKANPALAVEQTCNGYPRNKVHNGDWISESSNYAYGLSTEYACRDNQRSATYPSGVPMTTAKPGQTLRLRHWGNGHSRWDCGSPNHKDPGVVRIYWAGKKETEIIYKTNLTEQLWIPGAQSNFSADAVVEVQPGATTTAGMNEKADWMDFTLPEKIENGRHMMVWGWAWDPSLTTDSSGTIHPVDPNVYDTELDLAWTTCFDIEITDSSFSGMNPDIEKATTADADATSTEQSEVCGLTCYEGGMIANPCTGANCPPCRYKQQTNGVSQINCYQHLADGTCPWKNSLECGSSNSKKRSSSHLDAHKHKRHFN